MTLRTENELIDLQEVRARSPQCKAFFKIGAQQVLKHPRIEQAVTSLIKVPFHEITSISLNRDTKRVYVREEAQPSC
jgi:hypothetical protein